MLLMKKDGINTQTRSLALAGIVTGFVVLLLYLESIVPFGSTGFVVLASFILSAVFLEGGMKWLLSTYVASAILAFIVVPDKIGLLPFILLFGPYPAVKNLSERIKNIWLEWILKLIGFGVLLFIGYNLFSPMLPDAIEEGGFTYVAVAILIIGFVIFDLLFTQWIHFYLSRIAPFVKSRR